MGDRDFKETWSKWELGKGMEEPQRNSDMSGDISPVAASDPGTEVLP